MVVPLVLAIHSWVAVLGLTMFVGEVIVWNELKSLNAVGSNHMAVSIL
jgi:hypothetical protein